MRILQINSVYKYGSTGKIVQDLVDAINIRGHECKIAYGREGTVKSEEVLNINYGIDVKIHGVMSRLTDKHGFYSKISTLRLIKKIKKFNPDIIHLHNLHGYYINIEILFKYLKKIDKPVIWTLHDCWAFTGHCAHFDSIKCDKWLEMCYECPEKKNYPKSILKDNSKANYENKRKIFTGISNMTIVTPSKWLNNKVKQSFLQEYSSKIINNGIDLNIFAPLTGAFREKYNLKNKFIILGVASTWTNKKGFNVFLELSKLLDSKYIIVMVGVSKKQQKELPQNIIGINRTNNIEELVQIYSDANIFINPTIEDTFPTTNIESIACGTPVITFKTGGCGEIINENCGKVIKQDFFELVKSIKKFNENYINKIKCVENAKKFNKIDKINQYIELYEMIGGYRNEKN